MTKSELVNSLTERMNTLKLNQVEAGVDCILELMTDALSVGRRIEIRNFGAFSIHKTNGHIGRNPKTGEKVQVGPKRMPHFKPGKELKERINATL